MVFCIFFYPIPWFCLNRKKYNPANAAYKNDTNTIGIIISVIERDDTNPDIPTLFIIKLIHISVVSPLAILPIMPPMRPATKNLAYPLSTRI